MNVQLNKKLKSFAHFVSLFCFVFLLIETGFLCSKEEKSHVSDHPGHNKKFGSSGPFIKFEELNNHEEAFTKNFFDNYVKTKKPLIMRSIIKSSDAFKLWSDEYLLDVSKGYDDIKFTVETVKKESRNQEIIEMSLREFLHNYKKQDIYMVNQVPFFLKKDVLLPQPMQCEQAPDSLEQTMMWFSSGNTKSVTHTDDYENILCVIDGTKEIVMVDFYKHKNVMASLIDETQGSYSSMDVDEVDYEEYPGIEELEYYHTNISNGDCIYIPYKWVHQIRSYGRNIGINFWFNYEKIFEKGPFSDKCNTKKLDSSLSLDKFIYNSSKEDYFLSFKYFIFRQINFDNRKLENWKELLINDQINSPDEHKKLEDLVIEIFSMMDFDANGVISNEEAMELDINALEQIAGLLEEIDQVVATKSNGDIYSTEELNLFKNEL